MLAAFRLGSTTTLWIICVDYDLSSRQRLSTVGAIGAVHYLQNYANNLLLPYTMGTVAQIFPKVFDVEDAFTINNQMTNQLKYGFTRFAQPQVNATDGLTQYSPTSMGITNVPAGPGEHVISWRDIWQHRCNRENARRQWQANNGNCRNGLEWQFRRR